MARIGFILSLIAGVAAASLAAAQSSTVNVPPGNAAGAGVCSPTNVTALSFSVTAPAPGLQAVLACNEDAYKALLNADLTKPESSSLPAPLLDLSCTAANTTTCTKAMPANRKLKSQKMCILLKYGAQPDGTKALPVTVDVTWVQDTAAPAAQPSGAEGRVIGVGAMAAAAVLSALALMV